MSFRCFASAFGGWSRNDKIGGSEKERETKSLLEVNIWQ